MKILVVDDNRQVMETICDFLEASGHITDCAYNGEEALHLIERESFDVIVMDIMMPRLNGINTVQELRMAQRNHTPVLFLTARDQIEDKASAYKAGGDDYLVKPFSLQELLMRLEALTKRGSRQDISNLEVGELVFDPLDQQVTRAGQKLPLSKIQLQILKTLMERHPAMTSKQQLVTAIWGDEAPNSDALRSHIYALRNAMNKDFEFNMLETEHGRGYRLVTQE
ncbi:MAG TPA: DNA-binding response regulator [Gammaproteobacteria bacterium]|nr:DNA-binding response regulator [Gammaproteobacteria bacterium]MEC8011235.1 response regulator transcription factor [Pseudomonadota bacterium]HBF09236.1 DNA-binding response regulator [Gammaproteobacteria bacterium]HCK94178.1 DNA-binding response regulator [Gammaproteobacteria bacterium]|tara:strand:- start:38 stop:712 length:675 start_codon:yes stop_codon:yes gene_type:complete